LLVFGGLLVMMMIMRPEGLWPASRPKLEHLPGPISVGKDKPAEPSEKSQPAEVEGAPHASNP
jgi:hypothetical protein